MRFDMVDDTAAAARWPSKAQGGFALMVWCLQTRQLQLMVTLLSLTSGIMLAEKHDSRRPFEKLDCFM